MDSQDDIRPPAGEPAPPPSPFAVPPAVDPARPPATVSQPSPPTGAGGGGRRGHRYGLWIAISLLVVALLAAGALALVLVFPGHKSPAIPRTARELRASVRLARTYLNQEGGALASGKNADATIYSADLKLVAKQNLLSGYEYVLYTNRSEENMGEVVFRVYSNSAEVRGEGEEVKVSGVAAGGSD
ncbi:MAG: hypothetical protein V1748_10445, partial [Actinomycetota bacterium]